MRTLARLACFTFAALTACSPNIVDGRILCASTAPLCPDGYTCQDGRCYRGSPDAGERPADADATLEVSIAVDATDAAMDAGPLEQCTPSAAGAEREDENGNGVVDEGCALSISLVHPVTDALPPGAAAIRFPRISSDGRTLTFCRVDRLMPPQVWQARRSATNARFNAPVQLTFASTTSACAAQPFEDRYFFEASASAGMPERIYEGTPARSRELAAAVAGTGGSGHPFISADGTELFFEGNRRRDPFGPLSDGLYVSNRGVTGEIDTPRGIVFEGVPVRARRDMFPTLSPDGLTLFFVRVTAVTPATTPPTERATAMFATRTRVGESTFSTPVELPINLTERGSFTPSFATWEVFASSASTVATAGNLSVGTPNEGLLRARLCAGACPPAPQVPCTGTRSLDGLRCYTVEEAASSYARAVAACGIGGSGLERHALASVHSEDERELLWMVGAPGDRWVGASGAAWLWASGEPNTDALGASVYWADGQPASTGDTCAALSTSGTRAGSGGFAIATDCGISRIAICESDLWPTW